MIGNNETAKPTESERLIEKDSPSWSLKGWADTKQGCAAYSFQAITFLCGVVTLALCADYGLNSDYQNCIQYKMNSNCTGLSKDVSQSETNTTISNLVIIGASLLLANIAVTILSKTVNYNDHLKNLRQKNALAQAPFLEAVVSPSRDLESGSESTLGKYS